MTLTDNANDPKFIKSRLENLPFVSEDLPGIGGRIKAEPDHFVVEEILPYAPCGTGEHLYVTFKRSGYNTVDAAQLIQRRLDLKKTDMGWGGRKDKHAVAIQTISLRISEKIALGEIREKLEDLPFEILTLKRHRNKIKIGHVAGNRFAIVVSSPEPNALERAVAISDCIKKIGVPNFYGPQRFGIGFRNIDTAWSLFFNNKNKRSRKNPFMVSVMQSALFNIWLKNRMETRDHMNLVEGDIVKKTDTGGMFTIEDMAVESKRFENKEIVYTGPIFGFKMMAPKNRAGQLESDLLKNFNITPDDFRKFRAPGSRRPALLIFNSLEIEPHPQGIEFRFTLPSGAYATTVMREFVRSSTDDIQV